MMLAVGSEASGSAVPGTGLRHFLVEWAFLLLAPVAAWAIYGVGLWNGYGALDAWIYTGTGQAFPEFVRTFGWSPYYFTRFPVVFLQRVFCDGADPAAGYVLLRYLVVVLAGGALYWQARVHYGRGAAMFGYTYLLSCAIFPAILLRDYVTFLSIPAALAGIALWLGTREKRTPACLLAGFCFGVSSCSHPFTVTGIGCFWLAAATVAFGTAGGLKPFLRDSLTALAGALLLLGLGLLYYRMLVPDFRPVYFWESTTRMIGEGGRYAVDHAQPFRRWGASEQAVYVPGLLTVAATAMHWRECLAGAALTALRFGQIYTAFYLFYRFGLGRFVLESHVYLAHLTLVIYMLAPLVFWQATRHAARWRPVVVVLMLAGVMPIFVMRLENAGVLKCFQLMTGSWWWLGVLLGAAGVAIALLARPNPAASSRLLAGAVLLLVVQIQTLATPFYRNIYGGPTRAREHDLYQFGVGYARLWRDAVRSGAKPLTWYHYGVEDLRGADHELLAASGLDQDLVSISYAGMGDLLHNLWDSRGRGMPAFGDFEAKRLAEGRHTHLILMAKDPLRIAQGVETLRTHGCQLQHLGTKVLAAGVARLHIETYAYAFKSTPIPAGTGKAP